MKKSVVTMIMVGALALGLFTMAQAESVTFNFEGIDMSVASPISTYMGNLYGSQVNVWGAERGTSGWGYGNEYLWTLSGASGDFEINFVNTPITKIYGSTRGYVFDATDGADFTIKAYGSSFGNTENPNSSALIYENSWSFPWLQNDGYIDFGDINFSSPVYLLVFSNAGSHDVAIDDLKVEKSSAVPEPMSLLLLGLGLLGIGAVRRKK